MSHQAQIDTCPLFKQKCLEWSLFGSPLFFFFLKILKEYFDSLPLFEDLISFLSQLKCNLRLQINNWVTKSSYTIYMLILSAAFGVLPICILRCSSSFASLNSLPYLLILWQLYPDLIPFHTSKFGATTALSVRVKGRGKQADLWLLVFWAGRENGAGRGIHIAPPPLNVSGAPSPSLAGSVLLSSQPLGSPPLLFEFQCNPFCFSSSWNFSQFPIHQGFLFLF